MNHNSGPDPSGVGIGSDVYEQLWNNIDVEIGPGVLPDLSSTSSETLSHIFHSSESLIYSHDTCIEQINKAIQFSRNKDNHPNQVFLQRSQYLIARLVIDTLTRKESIFHRRRIAILPDNRLALVPASTHQGDIVCSFAGSEIPCILRPHKGSPDISNEAIHRAFPRPKAPRGAKPDTTLDCRRCQRHKVSPA